MLKNSADNELWTKHSDFEDFTIILDWFVKYFIMTHGIYIPTYLDVWYYL